MAEVLVFPEYVYLLRVVEALGAYPKAKIPTVELPVAEPKYEALVDEAPDDTTQPEYVYLLRVVEDPTPQTFPKANIPIV